MTAVAVSAGQFAAALLMGLGLGAAYELLRPLRPRFTFFSDGLFDFGEGYGGGFGPFAGSCEIFTEKNLEIP